MSAAAAPPPTRRVSRRALSPALTPDAGSPSSCSSPRSPLGHSLDGSPNISPALKRARTVAPATASQQNPLMQVMGTGPMLVSSSTNNPSSLSSDSPANDDDDSPEVVVGASDPSLPLLPPLSLSPVHSGIASSLTEESVILAPGSLDVIQPDDADSSDLLVDAPEDEDENIDCKDSKGSDSELMKKEVEEGTQQHEGLHLFSQFDSASLINNPAAQFGIKQEPHPSSNVLSHQFVTTGDLGNGEEQFILVVTGDHQDLLEGGYVTLQTTGPDGEPSFISVPASSLANMPMLPAAAVMQEQQQPVQAEARQLQQEEPLAPAVVGESTPVGQQEQQPVATEGIEPFSDVYTGEVLHVCPADCSFYCKQASDLSSHLSSKHGISIPSSKLSAVVFDSVNNINLKCSQCPQQCFRDVVLTYRGMSGTKPSSSSSGSKSNNNNTKANTSKKVVKRTVRQCKRCGLESSTKSSMIAFNAHVPRCHQNSTNSSSRSNNSAPLGVLRGAQGGHGRGNNSSSGGGRQRLQSGSENQQQQMMGAGGVQKIQCPICGVELGGSHRGGGNQQADLNAHFKAFHSVSRPTTTTTQIPTSSLIQFICPKCGDVFGSHSDLARHQDTFHGERIKYECYKCKFISDDLRAWNSHCIHCNNSTPTSAASAISPVGTPGRPGSAASKGNRHSSGNNGMQVSKQFESPTHPHPSPPMPQQQSPVAPMTPQCPRCDFMTNNINLWNDHYLNCTLKYAR